MRYWFDTEYIERPFKLDLISIGMVAEDGREFYAESNEVDWSKASRWTLSTVRPLLTGRAMDLEDLSYAVRGFVGSDEAPEFWGYYAAFDWVQFCGLFGSLSELPFHYPQFCMDIKQWAVELGDVELPAQVGEKHNSLADARWTRDAWTYLAGLSADRRAPQGGKERGAEAKGA